MKPRKFWIVDNMDNCIQYQSCADSIHVIEYSAYEALEKKYLTLKLSAQVKWEEFQLEQLTEQIEFEKSRYYKLDEINCTLNEQNKIMREALKYYKETGEQFGSNDGGVIAWDALQKCSSGTTTKEQ